MGYYLNPTTGLRNYTRTKNAHYFVDKTNLIRQVNLQITNNERFINVSRPRRFGKTTVIDMLDSYYGKSSKEVFEGLKITQKLENNIYNTFGEYTGNNIIRISFNKVFTNGKFEEEINSLKEDLLAELNEVFDIPDRITNLTRALDYTGEQFVFLVDEWDYIFHAHGYKQRDYERFTTFLMELFKDEGYITLVFMVGILPPQSYSNASNLNNFSLFDITRDKKYEDYFGFTESEVENLVSRQQELSLQEIKAWYNGYLSPIGKNIYNPNSVITALRNERCDNYWKDSGTTTPIYDFLKFNTADTKQDIVNMLMGNRIVIELSLPLKAGEPIAHSKEKIYAALVMYGNLGYFEGKVYIPNEELRLEYEKLKL